MRFILKRTGFSSLLATTPPLGRSSHVYYATHPSSVFALALDLQCLETGGGEVFRVAVNVQRYTAELLICRWWPDGGKNNGDTASLSHAVRPFEVAAHVYCVHC